MSSFLLTVKKSPNLLGRYILGALRLNWQRVLDSFTFSENCTDFDSVTLKKILSEHRNAFTYELGTLKGVQVDIPVFL